MKTSARRRLVRDAGLLLLSLLVLAIGAQAAQAALVVGGGGGSDAAATELSRMQNTQLAIAALHDPGAPQVASVSTTVTTQGRGGIGPNGTSSDASGVSSSTAAWTIGGAVVVGIVVVLGAWALSRRRRPVEAAADFCVRHPQDAMCTAAA